DYARERAFASDMLKGYTKSFDQTFITLAAGAIALSVTYVRAAPSDRSLLIGSWVSFALALVMTLLSFKLIGLPLTCDIQQLTLAIQRSEGGLSQALVGNDANAVAAFTMSEDEKRFERHATRWRRALLVLNMAGMLAFCVGIVLLFI